MKRNLTISRHLNKFILLLIIGLVFLPGLSGCSFPLKNKPNPLLQSDYLNHEYEYKKSDEKDCLRVLVKLLQAVDQKDHEAIKGMFSKEALEKIEDIDEKIDLFIETFPTWERKYDPSFAGMGKHANRGTITRWVKPTFDFESEGRQYVLKFLLPFYPYNGLYNKRQDIGRKCITFSPVVLPFVLQKYHRRV